MSKFDGTEGEFISLSMASTYLENYVQGPTFSSNNEIKAHYFGRNKIDDLLAQTGAIGLRAYFKFYATMSAGLYC